MELLGLSRIFASAAMPTPRPHLGENFESSVEGVYVVGDLAGAPVVKLALEQGEKLAKHLAQRLQFTHSAPYDVAIVGAGASGLAVALRLKELGHRIVVLEKAQLAATFVNFPQGKWIYDEPKEIANPSALRFEENTKDELIATWRKQAEEAGLEVREGVEVTGLQEGSPLRLETTAGQVEARFVVVASGVRGNPRELGVPGEDHPRVMHRLYNPNIHRGESILVVGGGDSAVEAAVTLSQHNRVTLSYRGEAINRANARNRKALAESSVEVKLKHNIRGFEDPLGYDAVYVLIGADVPVDFLKRLGLRLESEWTWKRWLALLITFAVAYSIYGIKYGKGEEFWPFTGWGYEALSFFGRGWSFWYTVLYTAVVTIFGLQAMKRWGFDRKDRFQVWRFSSLIFFQWTFFFLIPEFLFQWAVKYQWVGESLAKDPDFAGNAWRSYGLVYAWPLFFYTFSGNPHDVWLVWGIILSFVIIPVLVLFQGKRYCTWICGCGGLAETLGDRWRHLAPKGSTARKWEQMNAVVLAVAVGVSLLLWGQDAVRAFREPAGQGIKYYRLIVDTWLVGIIPVALYPFLGGKVWCRYWCPLAKLMEIFSAFYTRMRWSRFAISANDKCISCGECTRNCQVGIDVMKFALNQQELNNANSCCIGCGICITVCPMDVLSFSSPAESAKLVQIQNA